MTKDNRKLKVFLCYARVDVRVIDILYKRLIRDGVYVWLDKVDLVAGQEWENEILKAVHESDTVIVCHSKQFAQTGIHQKEVKIILEEIELHPNGDIFVIPARLEECDVLNDLRGLKWVDLFENLPIGTVESGYDDLLRALRLRASKVGATMRVKRSRPSKNSSMRRRNEGLVPDDVLNNWLIRHDITVNPFGNADLRSNPFYPEGAAWPDQWGFLVDSVPLFAHCPTAEDAKALAHLLRKECLPTIKGISHVKLNRGIFPIWVWPQQTIPRQSPLLTLAHSVARAWLNILPTEPHALLNLSQAVQNGLLELLCWSQGSRKVLINLIQLNGVPENEDALLLIRKAAEFESEFSFTGVPQDDILFSWLKIRPLDMSQTCLILSGDDLSPITPVWWFEQFSSLISDLFLNGVIPKMFASFPLPTSLSLEEMKLSWSNDRLNRSLDGQFDAVMHSDAKLMGKAIRFHELFGPGVSEIDTTNRFISASQNSLARMLTLGNRLLQKHCWKNASEKYLSIKELNDILG